MILWPGAKMKPPWPTDLVGLSVLGVLAGMIGFASLFSKYGTDWFKPATLDDQHRLEGYAQAVAPPGTIVAFSMEKYNTLEPVAYRFFLPHSARPMLGTATKCGAVQELHRLRR